MLHSCLLWIIVITSFQLASSVHVNIQVIITSGETKNFFETLNRFDLARNNTEVPENQTNMDVSCPSSKIIHPKCDGYSVIVSAQ